MLTVLAVDTTPAGTDATTDETTLASVTIPADTLVAGTAVRLHMAGSLKGNGNRKTTRVRLNGGAVFTNLVFDVEAFWTLDLLLFPVPGGQLLEGAYWLYMGAGFPQTTAAQSIGLQQLTEDAGAPIVLTLTGQSEQNDVPDSVDDIVRAVVVAEIVAA